MKRISFLLILSFLAATGFAGELEYSERVEGSSITAANFTVYDGEYLTMATNPSWNTLFENQKVINKVTLGLNPEVQQTTAFTGSASVEIKLWKWTGSSFAVTTVTRNLVVNYSLTGTNTIAELATFTDEDAHRMEVTVLSTTGLTLSAVYLEASIEVKRNYFMDNSELTNVGFDNTTDFIDFHWDTRVGAEFYELEWVHINDYTDVSSVYLPKSDLPFDFYLNATRVTIPETHYRIPKVFDHGYVLFRVRAVGMQGADFTVRQEGLWQFALQSDFLDQTSVQDYLITINSEFDNNMNWNHEVSYTENGKRFEGISFADGMGRGRQLVGVNPVTEQVIVSNPYYDAHGRPILIPLPTPQDGNIMHHFPDFNREDVSEESYSADHFDQGFIADHPECALETSGFDPDFGTGNYYSDINTDVDGPNKLVPDAAKFPFSRIQYTPDQTGRIQRAGNYGPDFQIGSGHETFISYGTPDQQELNRLFGTEVGYAEHYQRRVTVDANHQSYIEYYDLAGRLIASGLAGATPGNLEEIDGGHAPTDTEFTITDGTPGQSLSPPTLPISMSTTELVYLTTEADYDLNYSLDPEQYTSECTAELCFDCMYKLSIHISDLNCPETEIYDEELNINGLEYDAICNGTYPYELDDVIHLLPGNYYIEKTLEIDQEAIAGYWCTYLEANTCEDTYYEIFDELYLAADFSNCVIEEVDMYTAPCEMEYQMMLQDVSPGGQYGEYDNTLGVITATSPISVLNGSNSLGTDFDWEHPDSPYLDEDGNPAVIEVEMISPGVYDPAVKVGVTPTGPLPNGNYTVAPEELDDVADFINLFEDSWAESLLPFHPEYCYLTFCWENTESQSYDSLLSTVTSCDTACLLGFYNPLDMNINSITNYDVSEFFPCTAAAIDPFFDTGGLGYAFQGDMEDRMEDYVTIDGVTISMWEYALLMVKCPLADESTELILCLDRTKADDCKCDAVWLTFRELYLAEKRAFYLEAASAQLGCDNSCIGDETAMTPPCSYYNTSVSRWNPQTQLENNIDISNPAASAETLSDFMCESLCESYADDWIASLQGCLTLDPGIDMEDLKADLIELCAYSCDAQPPVAATSLPPTGPITLTLLAGSVSEGATFNDVLALYITGFDENDLCTELLISNPGQYNPNVMEDSYLDECGCTTLQATQEEFIELEGLNELPEGVTTMEELLAYNTGISLDDIDQWLCICNEIHVEGSWESEEIEELMELEIVVPSSLTCEKCTDCEAVGTMIADLHTRFDEVEDFELTANYPTILTNYLNQELGFTLTYEDYASFLAKCGAGELSPVCELTEEVLSWYDVMNIIVHRGQLMNDEFNTIDLLTENIAYPNSALQQAIGGTEYWSETFESSLYLHFENEVESTDCFASISLPEGADFGFEDIVGFGQIAAASTTCPNDNKFTLEVFYLDCGVLKSGKLNGSTGSCFAVQNCWCGGEVTLCNKTDQEQMANQDPCYQPLLDQLYELTNAQYETQVSELYNAFSEEYNTKCAAAFESELFTLSGPYETYQFTLFYYDQAGNLVKTVAPKGVDYLTNHDAINASRDGTTSIDDQETPFLPTQTYETNYDYNSFGQLVETANPDQEGETQFWYDYYGRIVASQNPVQRDADKWSYILYDIQGRPVQTGQVVPLTALTEVIVKEPDLGVSFKDWVEDGDLTEVTITTYDRPLMSSGDILTKFKQGKQQNLRLRVAAVAYFDEFIIGTTDPQTDYTSAIHYSYGLHGNVVEVLQDVPQLKQVEQDIKSAQYEFELISGNVKRVKYQQDERDQMTHSYTYDKLNRLTEVHTSTDGEVHESREAHYRYFDYGPLARVEIGEHKVQAKDHAYTINGWLKGMNSNTLKPNRDMGLDGETGYLAANSDLHELIARDVTGYTLGYYQGDYFSRGTTSFEADLGTGNDLTDVLIDLFNGNISHTVTAIEGFDVQAGAYSYDQLQRLKEMRVFRGVDLVVNNDWVSALETSEYYSDYRYDLNSNITTLNRNGNSTTGLDMDEFVYNYTPVSGEPSNRLDYVTDSGTNYGGYSDIKTGQSATNYRYDKLGQLVVDIQEDMTLEWRYGDKKIKKIERSDLTSPELEFVYNPVGQRVLKIERPRTGGSIGTEDTWKYTYYTYDANGQIMATYDVVMDLDIDNTAELNEFNIYGSNRIGVIKMDRLLFDDFAPMDDSGYGEDGIYLNVLGKKKYELTNHLGNVNAVITDRKIVSSGGASSIYEAVIIMKSDYYPFGMEMPGRTLNSGNYRFGYNGQENDNEIKGNGNAINYKWRGHDPRLGRFFQQDPLTSVYPSNSPYAFCENSPIAFIELEGLERASFQEIEAARIYAQSKLGGNPNGTSKFFPGLTNAQLLGQIDARLVALEASTDITNVKGGIWFCGPTAMIHCFLWFEPMTYVKAAIDLYESSSTLIDGKVVQYTKPDEVDQFVNGEDAYSKTEALDFLMISSLRSSSNEIAPKTMSLRRNRDVGTLPWELDNMARSLGLTTIHKNGFWGTNLRKIKKDIESGALVVLLDNGGVNEEEKAEIDGYDDWFDIKKRTFGDHYITIHGIEINRSTRRVTVKYWEHGEFNNGNPKKYIYTFREFKSAIKGQYSFRSNPNNGDYDVWDHRDGSTGPTLPDDVT